MCVCVCVCDIVGHVIYCELRRINQSFKTKTIFTDLVVDLYGNDKIQILSLVDISVLKITFDPCCISQLLVF